MQESADATKTVALVNMVHTAYYIIVLFVREHIKFGLS